MNFKLFILFVVFFLILISGCGIEDMFFFEEPESLTVDGSNPQQNRVYFTGFNQEEDDNKKLFIGYDVYYFINDEKLVKKAIVRNPDAEYKNTTSKNLINFKTTESDRFKKFSTMYDIYKQFTIPVTENMIDKILIKGNNANVEFYFHNTSYIGDESNDKNGKIYEKKVIMEQIYPAYSDYSSVNLKWGSKDSDFLGFYDKDYYDAIGAVPHEELISGNLRYRVIFYVVARGYSTFARVIDFTESTKSNYMEVFFEVDPLTKRID